MEKDTARTVSVATLVTIATISGTSPPPADLDLKGP